MMAAASTTPNLNSSSSQGRSWQNPSAPPLLTPETGNNIAALRCLKPSVREVNSRYMSTSSSFSSTSTSYRRSASPLPSRTVATVSGSVNKRSQSAERRRPATPTPGKAVIGAQMSAAAKALMSASKRSLSVSFQGESISTPIGKTKPAPPPNSRKSASAAMTPRNGEHSENVRSARSRQVSTEKPLSKSVDLGSDRKKLVTRSGNVVRSLQQSLAERTDQIPSKDKLQDITSNSALLNANLLNLSISASESAASDTESICSQNNSGSKDNGNKPQISAGARGVIVPARFWEETNTRLRRPAEPSPALSRSRSVKATAASSPSVNLTSRGLSPIRGGVRPASPSRFNAATMPLEKSSSSRTMASPGRVRSGVLGTSSGNTVCSVPSVLCFAADVRRGKLGESKISDAHLLRLMYNRNLQWRFANCKVEAALSFQRLNAERNLYNTWKAMSDFRLSVYNWRLEITRMSLKLKLLSIIKEQMIYLEKWALLEKDFVSSLLGATESFRASTVQLPIVCGATANIMNLKGAICSAVDVLQAMASSIRSLMSEVDKVNALLDEVVSVASSEHALLDECKDLLSALAAFQVKDCTLRAHVSQLKRVPPSLPIEA